MSRKSPSSWALPASKALRSSDPWGGQVVTRSSRLFVKCMRAVPAAVLLHLDALAVVLLVLHGDVVAPLALLAGQRDLDALLVPCHVFLPGWGPNPSLLPRVGPL